MTNEEFKRLKETAEYLVDLFNAEKHEWRDLCRLEIDLDELLQRKLKYRLERDVRGRYHVFLELLD